MPKTKSPAQSFGPIRPTHSRPSKSPKRSLDNSPERKSAPPPSPASQYQKQELAAAIDAPVSPRTAAEKFENERTRKIVDAAIAEERRRQGIANQEEALKARKAA